MAKGPNSNPRKHVSYGEYSIYYVLVISNNNNDNNNRYELFPKKIFCQVYKNEIFKNTPYKFINFSRKNVQIKKPTLINKRVLVVSKIEETPLQTLK